MLVFIALTSAIACLRLISAAREPFIVGGDFARIADFPFAAFLLVYVGEKGWLCGSSILNQRILLTAGHCVYFRPSQKYDFTVSVGSEHKHKGDIYRVDDFKAHEGYGSIRLDNDLALLRVKTPISFGSKVSRISIMEVPPREKYGYVSGWGLVDEIHGESTDLIKSAQQQLWTREKCEKELGNLPEGVICGGGLYSLNHAAPGDSGSALVIRKFIQVGLVSFKKPSVSDGLVVYTDVGYHYKWITRNAKIMYCKKKW